MHRSNSFHPAHEPFRDHDSVILHQHHITGVFSFLNPTRALFSHALSYDAKPLSNGASAIAEEESASPTPQNGDTTLGRDEQRAADVQFIWRSRDNRKGRHLLQVQPDSDPQEARYIAPKETSSLRATAKGIYKMFTVIPYWDVSYLVATIFTLGSMIWVINAFFVWLPLVAPSTEFRNEILTGGGVTAFIGATVFEVGSALLMFEAVNENNTGCFGWALEKAFSDLHGRELIRVKPAEDRCTHHHRNKRNIVGKATVPGKSSDHDGQAWQWYPSWNSLRTHYIRELGFLASASQFCGATIFWISGFTALPGINNHLSQGLLDGIYWTPQIVGGTGFIISGTLFMLETQPNWYTPAPHVLGWHIGLWNLIGALGFTLCGSLGPAYGNSGAQYQASLATFWGSWAFLIGSVIQWYESLDKHPVEQQRNTATRRFFLTFDGVQHFLRSGGLKLKVDLARDLANTKRGTTA